MDAAYQAQAAIIDAYDNYNFWVVAQKIHHFCSIDMGSFYLDIIKDRQYTAKRGSKAQRSCQTALYHIVEALVRWMAPILSFTANEIWPLLPKPASGEREKSVFISEWYDGLFAMENADITAEDWDRISNVKDAINKAIEVKRKDGVIGGSLQAEVTIHADEQLYAVLSKLEDELRFVFITSQAKLIKDDAGEETDIEGLKLTIEASEAEKCERCWHYREDVGSNSEHPTICNRCVDNVVGDGEVRHYA